MGILNFPKTYINVGANNATTGNVIAKVQWID